MKKNLIFALLAAGSLFSCQQQDEQLESSKDIHFTFNEVNTVTRSNSTINAIKKNFVAGDVISLAANGQGYSKFVIGKDSRNWSTITSNSGKVKFYALYPALTDKVATRSIDYERNVAGGEEYLFGEAEAVPGTLDVSLSFTRMTVPVIVLDENGNPYTGDAEIKLNLKNQGTQDLMTGVITVDENAPTEAIEVNTSEGTLTNILPQKIAAGEEVGTITVNGETEPVIASRDLDLKEGSIITLSVYKPKCGGGIIDGNVPLFY